VTNNWDVTVWDMSLRLMVLDPHEVYKRDRQAP
jgi:hypothetical protein